MRYFGKLRLITLTGFFLLVFSLAVNAQLGDTSVVTRTNTDSTQTYPVTIADVNITGYKQTKPYIIQREVAFHKDEIISRNEVEKRVELSRQQLMNTTLFVEVDVKAVFVTPEILVVDVHVKERWYLFPLPYFKMIDRNFNTWWVEHKRSLQRINYGLKFFHNNVSGRNDKLNIGLSGGYTQQVSLRYENPFLDKTLRHGMNVGVSYSRNRELNYGTSFNKQSFFKNENEFLIRSLHVDLAYSYRPAVKARHYFRVSYNDLQIDDTVSKLNPNYFPDAANRARFPDVSYNIQYFDVDYIPYPLDGFWGDAYLYKRFGKNNNLWQVGGKGTYTKKVLPTSFMQFQAAGMLRLPFNQPFINQRVFGNSDMYMRGMEYYVVDGVVGGLLRATAIQKVLDIKITNPIKIKTLTKIPVRVFLKAFTDAGYAYHPNPGTSMLNNKLLKSWGFGLDIVSIYDVVLRLEYSFNQLGDRGLYVHSRSDF